MVIKLYDEMIFIFEAAFGLINNVLDWTSQDTPIDEVLAKLISTYITTCQIDIYLNNYLPN